MAEAQDSQNVGPQERHRFNVLVEEWAQGMLIAAEENSQCTPNYFARDPDCLVTSSYSSKFILGTGDDIFTDILPSIEAAESEVIFVTCFWAASSSLEKLSDSLRKLSKKAVQKNRKIRVRIGVSSISLFQKLFHTRSLKGQTYPPSTWVKKLHLPHPEELTGLDLEVKSIFILPFSVMHPKFTIIDRKLVWLPSCNVSWESWFEGCIELSGPIVDNFITFWEHFWMPRGDTELPPIQASSQSTTDPTESAPSCSHTDPLTMHGPAHLCTPLDAQELSALFLPSPHRFNPGFRPFASQAAIKARITPLNNFILTLIHNAKSTIYIQTPNLTSPPVLWSLLHALRRGIHVHIVTSERLMILEQLVTAGTTTSRCLKKLIKRYHLLRAKHDEESNYRSPGKLRIDFFQAHRSGEPNEPVQSHLKLTIVDSELVVLGSGNMDRASWFTSQELGVSFHSTKLASTIKSAVAAQLVNRTKNLYDAGA